METVLKEELRAAKKNMVEEGRAYRVYGFYLCIPIFTIVLMIMAMSDINNNFKGTIGLFLIIIAHINVQKLTLLSGKKYVAPILYYIVNVITILLLPILFSDMATTGTADTYLGLVGIICLPIQIVSIVFFFITARDIKNAYPTMKEDAQNSRQAYLNIKKNK